MDIGGGRSVKDEFLYGINWGVVGERKLLEVDRLGVVHRRLLYSITIRREFGPNNETAFRVVQEISNDFVVKRGGVGGVVMMAFIRSCDGEIFCGAILVVETTLGSGDVSRMTSPPQH